MQHQITKSIRLPRTLIRKIERVAQVEASTLTQFVRTAVVNELKRKQVA